MNSNLPKYLVIGECGDGKSTLINALVGAHVAESGRNPGGVTKQLKFYPSHVLNAVLIDTPGVGDATINVATLLTMMEEAFRTITIHGVIVVSKEYTRVKMGGQLVARFVDMAFKSQSKWNNVIFAWTHGDKAEQEDVDNLPAALKLAMDTIKSQETPPYCITRCPGKGAQDVSHLINLVREINSRHGIGSYANPSKEQLAAAIYAVTGVDADYDKILKELDIARKEVKEAREEMNQQLRELNEKYAKSTQESSEKHAQGLAALSKQHSDTMKEMHESNRKDREEAQQRFRQTVAESEQRFQEQQAAAEERYRRDLQAAREAQSQGGFFSSLMDTIVQLAPLAVLML